MLRIFLLVCGLWSLTTVGFADMAGCDNDDNEYINQGLALCNVHAYNIGRVNNPTDANGRDTMQEVVALKTTIMTQQMNKQYEFLETTVRRFKTQLQKAILTAQVQAAGGDSDSSSSSGGTSGTYQDCGFKGPSETIYCVRQNASKINSGLAKGGMIKSPVLAQIKKDANAIATLASANSAGLQHSINEQCINKSSMTADEARTCLQTINNKLNDVEQTQTQSSQRR